MTYEATRGVASFLDSPSAGKLFVDTLMPDETSKQIPKQTGIPLLNVFEVMAREIKPRFQPTRDTFNSKFGHKQ